MTPFASIWSVRLFRLLLGFCATLLLGASVAPAQKTRTMTKTMDRPAEGEVEVIAERARVDVRSWDRPTVEVQATVRAWDERPDDRFPVTVTNKNDSVRIATAAADPEGAGLWRLIGLGEARGPDMQYSIRMPEAASLSVTTQEGRVEVQDLASAVTIEGYSASIAVRDLTGEVTAATFSGPVRAENVRGPLTVATFSGDMTVRGPSPAAEHTVASFSGSAEVTFPSDAAFDLRTDVSWGGSVTSDFALPDSTAQDDGPVPIGGGGPLVVLESFSGDLTLRAE